MFRRPGPEARLAAAASKQAEPHGSTRLVVVEDDPLFLQLVLDLAATWDGFEVEAVGSLAELKDIGDADVVLLDLHLPDSQGLETLRRALRITDASIVVFTGDDDDALGLEAVRQGAQDFVPKASLTEASLHRALRFARERARLERIKRDMVEQRVENERLRAIEQERARFYAGITRSLHGPMESLAVQTRILSHELASDGRRRSMEAINEQIDRLARLQADLMDIASIQAGGMELDLGAVDVADLMARQLQRWDSDARAHRVVVESSLQPGLTVQGDATRLADALDRIIDNAIQHTPAGGIITVELEAGDGATITITDHGQGIIPERLERVFEAYLWEPEHRSGLGMGLAICKGVVEAMGGSIEVTSPHGCQVVIRLPLAEASASA